MTRVSLACIRLLFFVMLFISTACNKVDRSLSAAVPAPAVAEAASAPSSRTADEARIAALSARVQYLEAELNRVNQQTVSDIPGGVTWD